MVLTYIGIPAPEMLKDDPWFGPAPETEKSFAFKKARQQAELDNQILAEFFEPKSREPENIHQIIYEIATKNVATTISLNPLPSLGGSENFQDGWMSGAGIHNKKF